jgi:tRNA (cytidine/uridine-2'-O-)-methyltransferase
MLFLPDVGSGQSGAHRRGGFASSFILHPSSFILLFMLHVVLVEPEIPPNTGNIGRLCLATDSHLHLVKPLGFSISDKALKRAGLDYWKEVRVSIWESLGELQAAQPPHARYFYLTTKTRCAYWHAQFRDGDFLVFGRETKGLPEPLLEAHPDRCLTIPMTTQTRSLNLATAVGIVLYEAVRQLRSAEVEG